MASSSTHRASSSTSSISPNYDVFLSFRGDDTRKNFTDYLYTTLIRHGIQTFRDDEELEKGGDIASDLSRAIEESRIFIVIFSKNYAYSTWCLNELLKITECARQKESTVVPVFYHVDPSDVRKQEGSFGDALTHHERDADEEKKGMIQKWRIALTKAANLSGHHVDDQYETEVVNEIINKIVASLDRRPLNVGKNIVGISVHLEKLKSMMNTELNTVRVIGIWGPGGIGKTTIAKAIYNEISLQFDGGSFLRNIKERSKGDTLQLQQELLHGILKGKDFKINNIDEGVNKIQMCLNSKRVLIIFDDVDELAQLEYLAQEKDWFGLESTIIITSRNKHVLAQYGVDISYEVSLFNKEEAIELFSLWAFKQNFPNEPYKNLSYNMIEYANGFPLALKVLGASLFGKEISDWKSALCKLKAVPHKEINNVLKISFDGLEDIYKGIFLDVACFFKRKDKDFVSRMLGPHAPYGITILNDKCLLTISENMIDMHDLIQQMGREIVRQECPKDPGRRSRIWDSDAYDVLTRNMGTQAIQGLFLHICKRDPTQFTKESFKQMDRLRLLKIHKDELFSEDHLPRDFDFPCYELTCLHWDGYSLESLPTNFYAKNLVELILRGSKIKQLWRGNKLHNKLKVIDLSHSVHLTEIPDFSSVPNLEILTLEGCVNLECLPRGIHKWKYLQTLFCGGCSKLKSFPEIQGNMRKLRELDLSGTAIKELPSSSFEHLKALEILSFRMCSKLNKIPIDVCCLSSLEVLDLSYCNITEGGIPSDICCLSSLKGLNLKSNDFRSIPATIRQLSRLVVLNLSHCQNLEQIPELPSSLRLLDAHDSNPTLSRASFLPFHYLVNCFNSEIQNLNWSSRNCTDSTYHGKGICIVLPGSSVVPDSIMDQERLIELPWNWFENNEFLGFAICYVYAPLDDESEDISESDSDNKSEDESAHNSDNETDDKSKNENVAKLFSENVPSCRMRCFLKICGENLRSIGCPQYESSCFCYDEDNDSVSRQTWVICYPKAAIPERYRSNQWPYVLHLFEGFYNTFKKAFTVVECRVRLIFSQDLPLMTQTQDADVKRCRKCQGNGICRWRGCFKDSDMKELPIIENPLELDGLCLRGCKNLKSLPTSICEFKSLTTLDCTGCSQLESFPEILKDMVILKNLYLDGTAIKEIPSSIQRLRGLQRLDLTGCKNLVNLPESICNLTSFKFLLVRSCPKLNKLPEKLGRLPSLECLSVKDFDSMIFQLPSLSGLCSLTQLWLINCGLREIPNSIWHLSSLKYLILSGNQFSSIPDGISKLYKLIHVDLSHCKMLQHIPEFPSSLAGLDVHQCTSLKISSSLLWYPLFKCFQSGIQEILLRHKVYTFIPGSNGIPEWISHQKKGSKITLRLPWNWYENNDFLGFALCSLHVPFPIELMDIEERTFKCKLNFNHCAFSLVCELRPKRYYCENCHDGDESNQLWLICLPKSLIPKKYHSNEYRTLNASFSDCVGTKPVKVEQCGSQLLYAQEYYKQNHLTMVEGGTSSHDHRSAVQDTNACDNAQGTERNHPPMIQYVDHNVDAHNKRNPIDQRPVEEPHHERLRETQD